ncbi:hypothetical protein [Nakamurella sp.]|uniref:hypothetical protein n=1 Tax=Nakamurella sp. TaxID=1869182 RepID=UPI003B3A8EC7
MTSALLSPHRPGPADTPRPDALDRAASRVAGAAFCARLDPAVLDFARRRLAAHFGTSEELVDALIADRLLRLAARLGADLAL